MTKISIEEVKNQIKTGVFYIDSARFLVDSSLFKSVTLPQNFITLDADTGETLSEFKKKSLPLKYKNFTIYIGQYKKVLKQGTYPKLMLGFSAKVGTHYLSGISKQDFNEIFIFLRSQGRLDFNDADLPKIIANVYTKDTDIAYNIIVPNKAIPQIREQWKILKSNSPDKENIRIGEDKYIDTNQMIQFGKRGGEFFFKIYNKTLEVRSDAEELNNLPLTLVEREFFLEHFNSFSMFRIEITIRNTEDFKKLKTSSKLVDLWDLFDKNPNEIAKLVRRYYDEVTGTYKPRKKEMQEISSTKRVILSSIVTLSKQGMSFTKIETHLLSLFGDDVHRNEKYRAKKLIRDLYDHYFANEEELKEQHRQNTEHWKYIEEMFFMNVN